MSKLGNKNQRKDYKAKLPYRATLTVNYYYFIERTYKRHTLSKTNCLKTHPKVIVKKKNLKTKMKASDLI